jgi:hypothetical protein
LATWRMTLLLMLTSLFLIGKKNVKVTEVYDTLLK